MFLNVCGINRLYSVDNFLNVAIHDLCTYCNAAIFGETLKVAEKMTNSTIKYTCGYMNVDLLWWIWMISVISGHYAWLKM